MTHQSVADQQSSPSQPSALSTDRVLEGIGKQEEPPARGGGDSHWHTVCVCVCVCVRVCAHSCVFGCPAMRASVSWHSRRGLRCISLLALRKIRFFFSFSLSAFGSAPLSFSQPGNQVHALWRGAYLASWVATTVTENVHCKWHPLRVWIGFCSPLK